MKYVTENCKEHIPYDVQQTVPSYLQRACLSLEGYLLVPVGHSPGSQHTCQCQLCRASPSAAEMLTVQPVVCLVHLDMFKKWESGMLHVPVL